jgi:hypothetical protein
MTWRVAAGHACGVNCSWCGGRCSHCRRLYIEEYHAVLGPYFHVPTPPRGHSRFVRSTCGGDGWVLGKEEGRMSNCRCLAS